MAKMILCNLQFKELTHEEALQKLPITELGRFPLRFFVIEKDKEEVGAVVLEEIEKGIAELSLTVFPRHRFKVLNMSSIADIFDFPLILGFKKVIGWTKRNSWKKVLKRIKGVRFTDKRPAHCSDEDKFWYEKTVRG